MAGADHRTVNVSGIPVKKEYLSAAIMTIGLTVQLNSSGKLAASNVASAIYSGGELIVGEAPERGKGIYSSGTIENTYAVDEQVPTIAPYRGCEVLVLLTSGQYITRGGLLEVAATGKCIAHAGSFLPAYRALETLAPRQDALILAQRL